MDHTSKSIPEWLKWKRMKLLPWPSQSLNLNQIEILWQDLTLKELCMIKCPNLKEMKQLCKEVPRAGKK